jgi:hypothetical protein
VTSQREAAKPCGIDGLPSGPPGAISAKGNCDAADSPVEEPGSLIGGYPGREKSGRRFGRLARLAVFFDLRLGDVLVLGADHPEDWSRGVLAAGDGAQLPG